MEGRNEDGNVLSTEPRPTRRILHRSSFYPSFYTAERSNRRRDWRSGRQTARASESKINCTIHRLLPMGTGFSRGLSRHDETLSKPRDRHHSGGRQRPRDSPISPAIVVSTIYHGCVNCTARAIRFDRAFIHSYSAKIWIHGKLNYSPIYPLLSVLFLL